MTTPDLDGLLAQLEGARRQGDGFQARCPAHEDRHPSLSIALGDDGRILVNCHAGCTTEAVLGAIGWTLADLFPKERGNGRRVVEVYQYDGFEVVRYDPKDFRQRRPNGNGGWTWNLDGVARSLYHSERLAEAITSGRTILIAEGERDVHALEALGEVATCNPGGAGNWRDEYAVFLAGAHVIVVADRDEPGRTHARQVAVSLKGIAASVQIAQTPLDRRGGDISDHLDAGLALEELEPLDDDEPLGNQPPITSSAPGTNETTTAPIAEVIESGEFVGRVARELLRLEIREEARRLHASKRAGASYAFPAGLYTGVEDIAQPVLAHPYVIAGLHPAGGNALLVAQRKTGKTTMALNVARSLVDDEPFLDRFTVAKLTGRVAIWNYELSAPMFQRWEREAAINNLERIAPLHLRGVNLPIWLPEHAEQAVAWHKRHDTEYWIVDPFGAAWIGLVESENDSVQVAEFFHALDYIKRQAGIPNLLGVHHMGWVAPEGKEHSRGASRIEDWPDAIWYLTADETGHRSFRAIGRDVELEAIDLSYRPDAGRCLSAGKTRRERRDLEHVVVLLQALAGHGDDRPTSAALAVRVPGTKQDQTAAVRAAAVAGYVVRRYDDGTIRDETAPPQPGRTLRCELTAAGRAVLEETGQA